MKTKKSMRREDGGTDKLRLDERASVSHGRKLNLQKFYFKVSIC